MRHAFSLVELILVIAIIAILAAVAAPRVGSASLGARIEAVEARMVSESLAVSESARVVGASRSIVIDAASDELRIYAGSSGSSGELLRTVDFGDSPYAADITGWSQSAKGHIFADGYGVFETSFKVTVSVGGISRNITVDLPDVAESGAPLSAGDGR